MDVLKNSFLLILILIGFLIRLSLITLPGFKFDMDAWFAWAIRLNQIDFSNFYSPDIWTNYTPGYLYILNFLGFIKDLMHISDNYFYLILKLPAILAEVFLAILVYKSVLKITSQKIAFLAAIFIIFNPALIFNSAVWGQIDSLLALFLLLSIYFLDIKKLIIASCLWGLAFLIKPQAMALAPVFGLYNKSFSINKFLKLIIPALLIILSLSLPFFNNNFLGIFQLFSKMVGDYSYNSLNAYNLWGVIGFWISDKVIWNDLTLNIWGYLLTGGYWLIIVYFFFKKKLSLYSLVALATLSFFFLPTRVHERYLYPAIPFLVLTAASLKSRLLWMLTGCLSLIHFLNLYYVYVYYNEFYLKMPKLLYNPTLYNLLATHSKILSLLSTIIFVLISVTIIKLNYEYNKT